MYNPKFYFIVKLCTYTNSNLEKCVCYVHETGPNFGTKPQGSWIWNNVPKSRLPDLEIWRTRLKLTSKEPPKKDFVKTETGASLSK